MRGISLNYVIAELRAAKQHTVTIGIRSHAYTETENHATFFFIVNMTSCMDGGCVRPAMTSHNMAAIPQLISSQAALVYSIRLSCWTSMLLAIFDTCQNEVFADQYHLIILQAQVKTSSRSCVFKLTADQILGF